jgi:KDO2-lipid IV(A) lauroyltransferase
MRKLLIFLSKRSFRTLYFISDIAYYLVYYIVKYRRPIVRKNLVNSFPEKNLKGIKVLEKKFYRQFCDQIMEMVKLFSLSKEEMNKFFYVENQEVLERLRGENRSIVHYLGHIGCWEYVASFATATNVDCLYIGYKKLTNEFFDKLMFEMRSKFNGHPVQDVKLLRTLAQLKKEGKRAELGFLADQSPMTDALNYWTTFLNQNTAMIDSIERIARKLDYAVCYLNIERVSRGVYKCTVELITDDITSTPANYVTEKYTRLLEDTIKKQPECFLWSHNRWKYTPADAKKSNR